MPISFFGNVALPREQCPKCEEISILTEAVDGGWVTACCDAFCELPDNCQREVIAAYRRRRPPMPFQKEQLHLQKNSCFWCFRDFGSDLVFKGRYLVLAPHWDHVIPFCISQNNAPHNFVAACQPCNQWKGSKMFKTVEEARSYLGSKWRRHEDDLDDDDDDHG